MRDIRDGAIYRSIRANNDESILTLTINVDGVQSSKNSQATIWSILLVINAIPPKLRYKIENVIIGVRPGFI